MEADRSSLVSSKRSCATQTPSFGEGLGEDSLLEYLSAHEEDEDSREVSEQREMAEVPAVPRPGEKVPAPVPAGPEAPGASGSPIPSGAVQPDRPSPAAGDRAPLGKRAEAAAGGSCAQRAAGTRAGASAAEGAETQLPASGSFPSERPAAGLGTAEKCSGGSPTSASPQRREALQGVPGVPVLARAVDGSSDLRARVTAGKSTSARVCLSSRAVNTEITIVNRAPPVEWLGQTFLDAASNTELSLGAQGSDIQEQQESKDELHPCDSKMGADRPEDLNKQTGKHSVSVCCQNVLQRATEAELQLLSIHHEMCSQHCLKMYELAVEENPWLRSCDEDIELSSSLQLVLDELDKNYTNMRMAINMGTPLNALPPLAVEVKFPSISSYYVASRHLGKKRPSDDLSGERKADFGKAKLQEKEVSVTMDKSQSDGDQPRGSASPETWEEQLLQTLESSIVRIEEGTERWFDAKEDLSASGFSAVHKKEQKQQGKQDLIDSREVKTVERGNEPSPPVGGPGASVPEEPGAASLQKPSTPCSPISSGIFFSPYALNLYSFSRLIRRLQERHPGLSRERILEALQEVRRNHNRVLSGLTLSAIEEETSAVLRRWVPGRRRGRQ